MKPIHSNYGVLITVFSLFMIVQYAEGEYNAWDVLIALLAVWFGVSVYRTELEIDDFEKFLASLIVAMGAVGMAIPLLALISVELYAYDLEAIMHPDPTVFGLTPAFLFTLAFATWLHFFRDWIVDRKSGEVPRLPGLALSGLALLTAVSVVQIVASRDVGDGYKAGAECMQDGADVSSCLAFCDLRHDYEPCLSGVYETALKNLGAGAHHGARPISDDEANRALPSADEQAQ